jgi:SpoVK/Ycf46/Vps4 family AAA+-type ATPase
MTTIQFNQGRRAYCWEAGEVEVDLPSAPAKPKVKYDASKPMSEYIDELVSHETDPDRLKWLKTYKRCVLAPHVKSAIEEALTMILMKDQFDKWGVFEHFEKGISNSILLSGPPGTGKTMIGESIAAVLGMNLMVLDSGVLESHLMGEAEKNIKENFKKATDENAVILLDECDSLLYDRSAVGMILGREINTLLTEIERFEGVVILTTNRLGFLDPALQRRIIMKIEIPLPTEEARFQIWQNLIPEKTPKAELNYHWLAAQELSGGEIKNAILLAIRKAVALRKDKLDMDCLKEAVRFVIQSANDYLRQKPRQMAYSDCRVVGG